MYSTLGDYPSDVMTGSKVWLDGALSVACPGCSRGGVARGLTAVSMPVCHLH